MPRSPSVPHTRLPIGASGSPQDPNPVDLEPFNPHIIGRSGVRGVCLVHHAYRPCNGCLAAEIDSINIAPQFRAARRAPDPVAALAVALTAPRKAGAQ